MLSKANLDREFVIRSQELVAEWAKENNVDLNEAAELETLHEKLQADDSMVEKSKAISDEVQAKFQNLLFNQLIPAIDRSKIDCKDGILMPDDVTGKDGSSIIITG